MQNTCSRVRTDQQTGTDQYLYILVRVILHNFSKYVFISIDCEKKYKALAGISAVNKKNENIPITNIYNSF